MFLKHACIGLVVRTKVLFLTSRQPDFNDRHINHNDLIEQNGLTTPVDFFGTLTSTVIVGHDNQYKTQFLNRNNLHEFIKNRSDDNNYSDKGSYYNPHIVCIGLMNLSLIQKKKNGLDIEPRIVGEFKYKQFSESDEKQILSTLNDVSCELNAATPFYNVHINNVDLQPVTRIGYTNLDDRQHYSDAISGRINYSKSQFIQKYGQQIVTFIIDSINKNKNNTENRKFKIGKFLKYIPEEYISSDLIDAISLNYDTNPDNVDANLWSLASVSPHLMTPKFIEYFQECVLLFLNDQKKPEWMKRHDLDQYNFPQEAISVKSFLYILNNIDINYIKNNSALHARIAQIMSEDEIRTNINKIIDTLYPEQFKEFLVYAPSDLFMDDIIDKILMYGLGSYYIVYDNISKYNSYDYFRSKKITKCKKYYTSMNHGCDCTECKKVRIIAKKICDNIKFDNWSNIDALVQSYWFTAVVEQMSDEQKKKYKFTDDFIEKCIVYQKFCYYDNGSPCYRSGVIDFNDGDTDTGGDYTITSRDNVPIAKFILKYNLYGNILLEKINEYEKIN